MVVMMMIMTVMMMMMMMTMMMMVVVVMLRYYESCEKATLVFRTAGCGTVCAMAQSKQSNSMLDSS